MLPDHLSQLPADNRAAVQHAFRQVFSILDLTNISLLSGGLSGSSVYKITADGNAYILKLNQPPGPAPEPSDALPAASAAGIAPKLHYSNPRKGIFITGFIENKPVRSIFKPDQLATKLAEKIRAIHEIPFSAAATNLFATVDDLISQFRHASLLKSPVFEECFGYYRQVKEIYPLSGADQVFSHNDLNPNNILCDGARIWIIDWDVASLNNRYVDLANAANYFIHTPENESAFLQTYFGKVPDDHQTACFHIMRPVCRIIYSLMMLQLAFRAKPANFQHDQQMEGLDMPAFSALMGTGKLSLAEYDGQLTYGKVLMNTALYQMRTPLFSQSLRLL